MHDQQIGDIQYIFYEWNNKYYKIKTYGLILKIGDVGASIIKPQDNVIFMGQCNDIEKTHEICDYLISHPKYFDFPTTFHNALSNDMLKKTCSYNILFSHPYDKIFWFSQEKKLLEELPGPNELLKYFDKYSVDKIDESENFLVV
jgi:hypothetical protein